MQNQIATGTLISDIPLFTHPSKHSCLYTDCRCFFSTSTMLRQSLSAAHHSTNPLAVLFWLVINVPCSFAL